MLLSPGRNVKNSDMHLLDMVRILLYNIGRRAGNTVHLFFQRDAVKASMILSSKSHLRVKSALLKYGMEMFPSL